MRTLQLLTTWCFLVAGCRGPHQEAPFAHPVIQSRTDPGFVTGYVIAVRDAQHLAHGVGFPIGPQVVVTVGHAMSADTAAGFEDIRFGPGPVPAPHTRLMLDASGPPPWTPGQVVRLVHPDRTRGDLAIIHLKRPVAAWDEHIDPAARPRIGERVLLGSPVGRHDDRVLHVVNAPAPWSELHAQMPGIPEDALFALPGLEEGWSGSPAKVLRSDASGAPQWITFGYNAFHCVMPNGKRYQIMVPLPADIGAYAGWTGMPPPSAGDKRP